MDGAQSGATITTVGVTAAAAADFHVERPYVTGNWPLPLSLPTST